MCDLEKVGYESIGIEKAADASGNLVNISDYKHGIFEMARWQPKDSGLPYDIWFDDLGKMRVNKHEEPRVRILVETDDMIPVSIEKEPKILLKGARLSKAERVLFGRNKDIMFKFISDKHEVILRHWNGEITNLTLFDKLRR